MPRSAPLATLLPAAVMDPNGPCEAIRHLVVIQEVLPYDVTLNVAKRNIIS